MAIIYPLALPSTPGYVEIRISAHSVVAVSESPFTLGQQVQKYSGQRWQIEILLPPMVKNDAEEWICFLLSLNGREGTFLAGDPLGKNPRGSIGRSTIKSYGSNLNNIGNKFLSLYQLKINTETGTFKKGDWICADNYLYKILNDSAPVTGDGRTSLDIWPDLKSNIPHNEVVQYLNCKAKFRLASNEMAWTVNQAHHYGLTIAGVEAL